MLSSLINKAKDLGFVAIGFSRPARPLHFDRFTSWLTEHKNAGMSWLERNMEVREDPSMLLNGCQSIISLAYPYPSQKPGTPDGFTVSRYSQPSEEDYHFRLKELCLELTAMMKERHGDSQTRVCVDSAPILERSFACAAGIGFLGKNNMLIIPGHGSYCYLAEILSTASMGFLPAEPQVRQCGTCRLCVDACPTGALEKPFSLDASKCLSYLTIEHEGEVNGDSGIKMGDCFFGCDRCQEVCPFNKDETSTKISLLSTDEFLGMDKEVFEEKFGKTALARAGLKKLKTNIQAVRT